MANVKINDLTPAGAASDSMQLETDMAGSVANKITVAQLSNKILDTDLGLTTTTANAVQTTNATTDGLAESDVVLTTPAANQLQLTNGTTDFVVQADCTIDQDLSTTSDVTFNSVDLVNQIDEFSTDVTLGGDSDLALPTEHAVRTYVNNQVGGTLAVAVEDILPITFDGQTAFTLSTTPISDAGFALYLNGQLREITNDYTRTGLSLTWLDPSGLTLKTTDVLIARYNDSGSGGAFHRVGTTISPVNDGDVLDMETGNYQIEGTRVLAIDTARNQLFVGEEAGHNTEIAGDAYRNTAVGSRSLYTNAKGLSNTAIGYKCLELNSVPTDGYNTAIGSECLRDCTGTRNTGLGVAAGYYQGDGDYNVYIGAWSGAGTVVPHTKSNNVMIGYFAGNQCNGDGNVFIGYQAGFSETGNNKLYIENSNSSSPLIYGEFNTDLVKINGTLEVSTAVELNGQGSAPSTTNGTIYYNSSSNNFQFRENGSWETLGSTDYWSRTGTTLEPATAGDDVDLGTGELIAAGVGAGTSSLIYTLQANAESTGLAVPLLIENQDGGATSATGIRFKSVSDTTDVRSKAAIFFERTEAGGVGSLHLAVEGTNDDSNVDLTDAKLTIDSAGDVSIANDLAVTGDISATDANFTGKLTVGGVIDPTALVLDAQASAPSTTDGTIYYNSSSNNFQFRENGSWETLGGGTGYWSRTGTTLEPATAGDDLDMGTGDITGSEITGTGVTINDSTPALIFADTDDDYFQIMTNGDNDLHFSSLEAGAHAHYKFFTNDGDGTNNISFSLFGVGTTSSTTNAEWLEWHFRYSASEFEIGSRASGTGTVRPLQIYTGSNSDQILLETDGNVYMSGNLVVEKSITFEVDDTDVSNPPTDAELDSAYGTPPTVGAGWTTYLDDNGAGNNFYQIVSDGTNWWVSTFTKAV